MNKDKTKNLQRKLPSIHKTDWLSHPNSRQGLADVKLPNINQNAMSESDFTETSFPQKSSKYLGHDGSRRHTTKSVKISPEIKFARQSQFLGRMSTGGVGSYVPSFATREVDDEGVDGEDQTHSTDLPANLFMSKTVNPDWYKRYAHALNKEERVVVQPIQEVSFDEADAAMRYVFGKYYREELAKELADDSVREELFERAITQHKKLLKGPGERTSHKKTSKPKEVDKNLVLCKKIQGLWQKNMGVVQDSTGNVSNWILLKSVKAKAYVKTEYPMTKKAMARLRFIKIVKVIMHIKVFIRILIGTNYTMIIKLSEHPGFVCPKESEKETEQTDSLSKTVKMFDPSPYKSLRNEETNVPGPIVDILTKPWYARSVQEIGIVVKYLYPRLVYQKYPMKIQMQLANVGWYSFMKKQRPIVRQGNPATRFFILLSGQIEITEVIDEDYNTEKPLKTKLMKYVGKGERFGDDEAEISKNKRRFYNAVATTACEVLSIDYNDYQNSLLLYDAEIETSPPHVGYINALPLFSSIKLLDLLRASKSKVIQLFYFTHQKVITESLEKSEFVFVVMMGTCHTASKQISRKPNLKNRVSEAADVRPKDPRRRKSIPKRKDETTCPVPIHMDLKTLSDRQELDTGKFMKSHVMTQDFVSEIGRISETSLKFSKEDVVKKILNIKLMKLIGGVYGQDCSHRVAEQLADRMYMHEMPILDNENEMKKIKAKTLKFQKQLSRFRQMAEGKSRMNSLIARARHSLFSPFAALRNTFKEQDENVPSTGVHETTHQMEGMESQTPTVSTPNLIEANPEPSTDIVSSQASRVSALDRESKASRHAGTLDRDSRASRHAGTLDRDSRASRHARTLDRDSRASRHAGTLDRDSRASRHAGSLDRDSKASRHAGTLDRDSRASRHAGTLDRDSRASRHAGTLKKTRDPRSMSVSIRLPDDEEEEEEEDEDDDDDSDSDKTMSTGTRSSKYFTPFSLSPKDSRRSTLRAGSRVNHKPPSTQHEDPTVTQHISQSARKTIAFEEPRRSVESLVDDVNDEPPVTIQYSPPVTSFTKGDVIGNDYVDYNDGRFRCPESDFALISGGVELVLVAKSFLLEHLYNFQSKSRRLPSIPDLDASESQSKLDG